MRSFFAGRRADEIESLRTIEHPNNEQVREALDVREPGLELRQDLDYAIRLVLCAGTFRNLHRFLERRPRESDRARCEEKLGRHRDATVACDASRYDLSMRSIVLFVLLASAAAVHAQVNDSEVWVGSLDMSGGRFVVSNLTNISKHPGYDNQPAFFPDGKLVFTSQIAPLDETGHAVQAVIHDFATGTSTPVPGALGFSPTPAADGSLMLLRDGHVVLHEASGKESQLTETKDAGYFARFDEQTWVLYMNDKQRRIVIYDPKTKALDTMALGSITAPFRIPGKRAVSFVAVEP